MGEKSSEESSASIDVGYKKLVCKDGCVSLWVVKLENIYFGCSNLHSSPPSAYSFFLCTENFVRKESDIFVHIKLKGIMWSFLHNGKRQQPEVYACDVQKSQISVSVETM